jgi:hypothetical protein
VPPGENRLRQALGRLRSRAGGAAGGAAPAAPPAAPLQLQPTTPLEALILERITALQADVAALQDQQRWLIRLTAGAIIAAILNTFMT